MKKGARIILTVMVNGEDEPANDFSALVIKALTWAINMVSYFPDKPGLSVDIQSISEDPGEVET